MCECYYGYVTYTQGECVRDTRIKDEAEKKEKKIKYTTDRQIVRE